MLVPFVSGENCVMPNGMAGPGKLLVEPVVPASVLTYCAGLVTTAGAPGTVAAVAVAGTAIKLPTRAPAATAATPQERVNRNGRCRLMGSSLDDTTSRNRRCAKNLDTGNTGE